MNNKTYKYSIENYFEEATVFETDWHNTTPHHLAELAAEEYFSQGEGWGDFEDWPLIFTIYEPDGEKLGVFEVQLEAMPSFFASEYKESENANVSDS